MVVMSVDVPEKIAKKFDTKITISSYELYEELDNNTIVDFWKKWVWKDEFKDYLANK